MRPVWATLAVLLVAGCSDTTPSAPAAPAKPDKPEVHDLCDECETGWSCVDGMCIAPPPTPEQLSHLETVDAFISLVQDNSGWIGDLDVDVAELRERVRQIILTGDGGEGDLRRALRVALLAYPVGHQAIVGDASLCQSDAMFWQWWSRVGACARPAGDRMVITHVAEGNPLGLVPGDLVTAVDGKRGDEMFDTVLHYPSCGSASATSYHGRMSAATSVFGATPPGTIIEVEDSQGTRRDVVMPTGVPQMIPCRDPMGRDLNVEPYAYVREDGIAVIRLIRFFPRVQNSNQTFEEQIAEVRQGIADVFAQVADAPAIIWDARANEGGYSQIGFDIVAGMPGATEAFVAGCDYRIPGSDPPAFYSNSQSDYRVTPGEGPFAYDGKVAVLVDALSGSAGDYFPLAVKLATSVPLVGNPSSGAFGSITEQIPFGSASTYYATLDPYRCADERDVALEGRPAAVDLFVEQDPADLRLGIDTQLEAAAALLSAEL